MQGRIKGKRKEEKVRQGEVNDGGQTKKDLEIVYEKIVRTREQEQ